MSAEVIFRDFKRSKATESYVVHQVEGYIEKFVPDNTDYSLKIRIGEVRHRNSLNRKPKFQCSLALKFKGMKQIVNVTRDAFNFHSSVSEAAMALRKILRRKHDQRIDRKRHGIPRAEKNRVPENIAIPTDERAAS